MYFTKDCVADRLLNKKSDNILKQGIFLTYRGFYYYLKRKTHLCWNVWKWEHLKFRSSANWLRDFWTGKVFGFKYKLDWIHYEMKCSLKYKWINFCVVTDTNWLKYSLYFDKTEWLIETDLSKKIQKCLWILESVIKIWIENN